MIRTPSGAEYGLPGLKEANKLYPESKIVRYQDGTPYEGKQPKEYSEKDETPEQSGDILTPENSGDGSNEE